MPEFPDVTIYIEHLEALLRGKTLERIRVASPFVLRSVDPPLSVFHGRLIQGFRRIGKRIVFEFDDELFLVIHLMIAGRFRWRPPAAKIPGKLGLVAFDFENGSLLLTEAGTKKRASLNAVRGEEALQGLDPGGLDVFACTNEAFHAALVAENHTLKRVLTDPHVLSGIGNAYSDEILHHAKLSPLRLTQAMTLEETQRLLDSTRTVLSEWTERLRSESSGKFPEHVTAFRPEMAVHGKFKQPCPVCATPVQRIVHGDNETNYCPTCQTGGKLLADRALSRLLRKDWPKTWEEMEERKSARRVKE